jgi:hypothetical protein
MMEAVRTSETSVDNYFTLQYIPEDNSEQQVYFSRIQDSYLICAEYFHILSNFSYFILCSNRHPNSIPLSMGFHIIHLNQIVAAIWYLYHMWNFFMKEKEGQLPLLVIRNFLHVLCVWNAWMSLWMGFWLSYVITHSTVAALQSGEIQGNYFPRWILIIYSN